MYLDVASPTVIDNIRDNSTLLIIIGIVILLVTFGVIIYLVIKNKTINDNKALINVFNKSV